MTRLVVSQEAEAVLGGILDYLELRAGAQTAAGYAERFRRTILLLVDFPAIGTLRSKLGQETRIAVVYPYILIYDFNPQVDTLVLLRIVHGRRNISKRLVKQGRSAQSGT